jgi:hypothetical protein
VSGILSDAGEDSQNKHMSRNCIKSKSASKHLKMFRRRMRGSLRGDVDHNTGALVTVEELPLASAAQGEDTTATSDVPIAPATTAGAQLQQLRRRRRRRQTAEEATVCNAASVDLKP